MYICLTLVKSAPKKVLPKKPIALRIKIDKQLQQRN